MKLCAVCKSNAARYTTRDGRRTCAICPLGLKLDSIRDGDVEEFLSWLRTQIHESFVPVRVTPMDPERLGYLLGWAREWLSVHSVSHRAEARALRLIIGVDVSK